jgi:hypothetical protein
LEWFIHCHSACSIISCWSQTFQHCQLQLRLWKPINVVCCIRCAWHVRWCLLKRKHVKDSRWQPQFCWIIRLYMIVNVSNQCNQCVPLSGTEMHKHYGYIQLFLSEIDPRAVYMRILLIKYILLTLGVTSINYFSTLSVYFLNIKQIYVNKIYLSMLYLWIMFPSSLFLNCIQKCITFSQKKD